MRKMFENMSFDVNGWNLVIMWKLDLFDPQSTQLKFDQQRAFWTFWQWAFDFG